MKTPKFLPWYARKAGISIEQASALWTQALCKTTAQEEWIGSSEFWQAATENFLSSLEEAKKQNCTPRVTVLVRSQNHLLRLPLIAMEDVMTAFSINWQKNIKPALRLPPKKIV